MQVEAVLDWKRSVHLQSWDILGSASGKWHTYHSRSRFSVEGTDIVLQSDFLCFSLPLSWALLELPTGYVQIFCPSLKEEDPEQAHL
ncbi:hypothetical protein CapIbe_011268 [Capra ibex]